MKFKNLARFFSLLIALSLVLAACAPAVTATDEAPTVATDEPAGNVEPTVEPVEEPAMSHTDRHGGWLDEIDYSVVDADSVITQINAGAIDLFSYGLASDKLAEIKDADLCYSASFGTYYDFLFNPAVFNDTTRLNPFSNIKIREAMNWMVDRNYINQEIFLGGVLPKFFPLTTQLVDYTGLIDVTRGLEAYYAYNPDKAKEIVDTEMVAMGAEMGADGKWQYQGNPVTLIFLIRNDGDGTRLPQGEYFAQQLESLGFTVQLQPGRSSELSPLWIGSDAPDGLWSLYTAGWGANGLSRDERRQFQDMYLPNSGQGIPLFTYNQSAPAFQKVGDDLAAGNFSTIQERRDLMAEALPLALQDSLQVWTVDLQTFSPYNCDLQVSADVGAGVESTQMAPLNLRIKGEEGGQVKVGTTDTIFADPWNPVNGSNWVGSSFVHSATDGAAFMPDPYTGLSHPLRAESAEVTVQVGLPVISSLDWVTLDTADQIVVPEDAWVDWDATTQKFVTAGEKFPDGTTSKTKVVINYPADLFDTVKWHDGSNLSVADFVMAMILTFDEGKPESAIYDEDIAGNLEAYLSHFKGLQIESTSPLRIALYDDKVFLDAELIVSTGPATGTIWPQYGFGESPWQTIAIGNAAEANGELAWGAGKADLNEVEWTSFIGGPSLEILTNHLDQALADKTIPYAATMAAYLTADEAAARYSALKDWYAARGHFWVGTGAYYLDSVDLNALSAVVKNNPEYADPADRWSAYGEAPLADAALDGPGQVKIGDEAIFTVVVTTKSGDPYPSANIKELKFLLYNDKGETVYIGAGQASGGEGEFTLTVPADVTAQLVAGTGKIEAAAVLIPVAIPAFTTLDYVVVP